MISEALRAAIYAARSNEYPAIRQGLYQAMAAGHVSDDEAAELDALLNVGRQPASPFRTAQPRIRRGTIFPSRPAVRRPDPKESVRRRRFHAQGALPPSLAVSFTVGELAVLAIVGAEMAEHGHCDRSLAEIAARAGVCRSLVQRALKAARTFGLLTITARPVQGAKNRTNVVRITDARWLAWLTRGIGSTTVAPTNATLNRKQARQRFVPFAESRAAARPTPPSPATIMEARL